MFQFVLILVLSIGVIQYASAVCNACNKNNEVACVGEKDFYLCYGGIADTSNKFSCLGKNEVCTKYSRACMDTTGAAVAPACSDTSNCGKCGKEPEDEGMYTCTSRTTYTMCLAGELTDIRGTCPENRICDITLGKQKKYPCVPACKESKIELCDLHDAIDVPITKTTTELPTTTTELPTTTEQIPITTAIEMPTTTTENVSTTTEEITTTTIVAPTPPPVTTTTELPTRTQTPADLVCSQKTLTGRYPYPNDTTCKRFIYCLINGDVRHTYFLKCLNPLYFNPLTKACAVGKPQGCI